MTLYHDLHYICWWGPKYFNEWHYTMICTIYGDEGQYILMNDTIQCQHVIMSERQHHCHRPEAFYQILTCLIWALWVHVTYLFTKCVTESCDSPDWLIQYCLSSASSRVTETVSMKMPCGECFQKCFSAYNMISLWLNTVISIIVMIWLPKMTRYLHWRIIYRHLTLVTF